MLNEELINDEFDIRELPIGRALIHVNMLLNEQLEQALALLIEKRNHGADNSFRIGDAISQLGFLDKAVIDDFASQIHGIASKKVKTQKTAEPHEFISSSATDAAPVRYLNSLFREAAESGASDIHFEDNKNGCSIRFRLRGELVIKDQVSAAFSKEFDAKMRSKSRLSLIDKTTPLDSKFAYKVDGRDVDVRVSILPLNDGKQSIVCRLLDSKANSTTFEDIEMPDAVRRAINHVISQPQGLFLVTGPTGSGKTTTLYSLIKKLNQPNVKIITAEDPIEYQIDGIAQSQMTGKITFASALKSMLRQDPDVILVGEIRDGETAKIAVQSALTGHLVLSTLHSNSALLTLERLLDLGVNTNALSASIGGFMAQRLVRTLCDLCKVAKSIDELDCAQMLSAGISEAEIDAVDVIYEPSGCGCGSCSKGWKGRAPIFELVINSKSVRLAVEAKDMHALEKAANEQPHYATLAKAAMKMVLAGKTSIAEALAVTGSGFIEMESE